MYGILLSGYKKMGISLFFFKEGQAFMCAIILGASGYVQELSCIVYALCRITLPVPTLSRAGTSPAPTMLRLGSLCSVQVDVACADVEQGRDKPCPIRTNLRKEENDTR